MEKAKVNKKDRQILTDIFDLGRRFTRGGTKKEIEKRKPSRFDNRIMRIREHTDLHKVIREDVIPILNEWIDEAENISDRNVKDHMVLVTQQGVKSALRRVKSLFEGQGQPEEAP